MEFAEHVSHLLTEGRTLAATARRAGADTAVGSCPEWTVHDLLVHTGGVHRWATMIVGEGRTEFPSREERAACGHVPAGVDPVDWFEEGLETVSDTLLRAAPNVSAVTIYPGRPAREFWARRMAHETLVHRLDAELAAEGALGRVDPDLAADGLAELLEEFLPRRARRLVADPARTILAAADEGPTWTLRIGPDGLVATQGAAVGAGAGGDAVGDAPDLHLRGPVTALHAVLWNRAPWSAVAPEGDDAVRELWRSAARI